MKLGMIMKSELNINISDNEKFQKNQLLIKEFYHIIMNILFSDIQNLNKKYQNFFIKINYFDIFYFMIQKSAFSYTYEHLVDIIYQKYNINVSAKTLRQKFNLVTSDYITKILERTKMFFYEKFIDTKKTRILSCDGTTARTHISLKNEGFPATVTDSFCNVYISTIFDSTNKMPIAFFINNKKDERFDVIQLIKYINANDIIIFDRGYPSYAFMKILNDKNIKYIIRSKDDIDAVTDIETRNIFDETYTENSNLYKGTPFRIIKYKINDPIDNNSTYYFLTNLFDMDRKNFSDLYFKRWNIEVFYDKFKNYVYGDYIDVRSSKELYKMIQLKFFVIIFTRLIIEITKKILGSDQDTQKNYKIINFKSAQRITINSILNDMIYDYDNYKNLFCHLVKINSNKIFSIPERSFLHYPTKENIKNNDKKKLKFKSKYNVKNKENINIYHQLDDDIEYEIYANHRKQKEKDEKNDKILNNNDDNDNKKNKNRIINLKIHFD